MSNQAATVESRRAFGKRFFAAQDALRGGPDPELCAPDYTAQLGCSPTMDLSGHQARARAFYAGMPDLHHEVEQVLVEGDTVVVRCVLHGTHSEPLFGIPPTHKKVAIGAHVLLHVQDGKVTKLLGIFDEAGMLRQIGILQS
jgi:predicted ester cyclase